MAICAIRLHLRAISICDFRKSQIETQEPCWALANKLADPLSVDILLAWLANAASRRVAHTYGNPCVLESAIGVATLPSTTHFDSMGVASMPLGSSPSLARPLPTRTGAATPKHAAKHAGIRNKPMKRCLAALPPEMIGGAGDAVDAAVTAFNHIGGHVHMHFPAMALERVTAPCSSMNCGDIVYRR